MSSGITRDDWLRALESANISVVDDQDAVTADEFAALFSIDRQAASRRLKALERAGKATRTTKRAAAVDGRMSIRPAFKLVQEPPKKRR